MEENDVKRQKYKDILDSLSEFGDWLSSLGIQKGQDRIHKHLQNIRYLKGLEEAREIDKLCKDQQIEIGWSLVEAIEFRNVFQALRNEDPKLVRRKIKDALQGPADPNRENKQSNLGRNTVFELNLAARLKGNNINVIWWRSNPDILCSIDGRDIYIQCKRPFFEKNIPVNIARAKTQLTRDLNDAGTNSRGIIAISISRALNKGDSLFVGNNEDNMMRGLANKVNKLSEKYKNAWSRIVDTRIIGILFHIITPAFIEDIRLFTAMQDLEVVNLVLPNSYDGLTLRQFSYLLKTNNKTAHPR